MNLFNLLDVAIDRPVNYSYGLPAIILGLLICSLPLVIIIIVIIAVTKNKKNKSPQENTLSDKND